MTYWSYAKSKKVKNNKRFALRIRFHIAISICFIYWSLTISLGEVAQWLERMPPVRKV